MTFRLLLVIFNEIIRDKKQMTTNISNTWWESYRETLRVTKLYRELLSLVDNSEDVAQSIIDLEKRKYPGKTQSWYLNKIIDDLKQQNLVNIFY